MTHNDVRQKSHNVTAQPQKAGGVSRTSRVLQWIATDVTLIDWFID
jgi:hypothetical protein